MAYSNLGQIHMLAQEASEAERWATKAIESAREVGDQAALAHALNNLGSTRARAGDLNGIDVLRESLEVSLREGLEDHVGRAYANIIWTLLDFREFEEASARIEAGLAYADKRELEGSLYYMTAERARLRLCLGQWDAAERDARWVIGRPEEPGITRMPALATLAQLEVRRGGADALHAIDEARALAEPTGELQRIGPVVVARAERAWLEDDLSELRRAVEPVYCERRRDWSALGGRRTCILDVAGWCITRSARGAGYAVYGSDTWQLAGGRRCVGPPRLPLRTGDGVARLR